MTHGDAQVVIAELAGIWGAIVVGLGAILSAVRHRR